MIKLTKFLYKNFLKRILFLFDAELVHNHFTKVGKTIGGFIPSRWFFNLLFNNLTQTNKVTLMGIDFPGKVGLSAGFDYNGQLVNVLPTLGFGWHTIGTVTYLPYEGNPKPRLGRFPKSKALLVNKGLKSWGAKAIIKHLKKFKFTIPVAISIASTNKLFKSTDEQIKDIEKSFILFEKSGLDHKLYELNISCPNTFGGEPFFAPKRLSQLLNRVDKIKVSKPIIIKMPIDQSEQETLEMLKIIDKHKIAGVIFGNLTKDKNNPDVKKEDREKWLKAKGNLSGKPTWKRSNKLIKLAKKHYKNRFVIVGTGGIMSGRDAREKIRLGADLIQLISGMIFEGPQLINEINDALAN